MVHVCYGIFWSGQFEALVLHVHGEIIIILMITLKA